MSSEVIIKEKELYPAWGGIRFSRAFALKFPFAVQLLNDAVNQERFQAEKRAFASATGIAWEDRYKTVSKIATSANIEQAKPSDGDMLSAIKHIQSLVANMRKMRYQTSEFVSTNECAISRTKSYEMILVHPQHLNQFLASFELSDSQLSFLGLSPATDAEWLEWIDELAAEARNRREQSNPTDKP